MLTFPVSNSNATVISSSLIEAGNCESVLETCLGVIVCILVRVPVYRKVFFFCNGRSGPQSEGQARWVMKFHCLGLI